MVRSRCSAPLMSKIAIALIFLRQPNTYAHGRELKARSPDLPNIALKVSFNAALEASPEHPVLDSESDGNPTGRKRVWTMSPGKTSAACIKRIQAATGQHVA